PAATAATGRTTSSPCSAGCSAAPPPAPPDPPPGPAAHFPLLVRSVLGGWPRFLSRLPSRSQPGPATWNHGRDGRRAAGASRGARRRDGSAGVERSVAVAGARPDHLGPTAA